MASFEKITFNLYSRLIGAISRLVLLFAGLIATIIVLLAGAVGLFIWILLPFLSYGAYQKSKKHPRWLVQKIRNNLQFRHSPAEAVLANEAGDFLVKHLGISLEEFLKLATTPFKISRTTEKYKEVIDLYLKNTEGVEHLLNRHGNTVNDCLWSAAWWDKKRTNESGEEEHEYFGRPGIGLELLFGYTPELNKVAKDLAISGEHSHHLIGRDDVIKRIERVLSTGKNVILKGIPGVGKKTIINEFAFRAALGELGPRMSYKRIVDFDINTILSQSTDINQKKIRLINVLNEAGNAGNIIMVIHDLERITNLSVEGYDFTSVFESGLSHGDLKIIANIGEEEFERYVASNIKLIKYFEPVEVIPPSKDEAMSIIIDAAENWERKKRVTIMMPALRQIIDGCDRYITDIPFPEKALEILDQVIIAIDGNSTVTIDDVNKLLEEKTGVPFARLNQDEKTRLGDLEQIIHQSLINQDAAIRLIAQSLRARSTGMKDESRPVGSFLFLGPTGVGKTETAKVLAKVYYGDEKSILRFDMAEYASSDGLDRLIGSVSRGTPGVMTTAIKNKPASILLLDEIEKAPSEIKNLFLTVLEEGFITDAFGKKINCQNLMVIATSNAGAENIRQLVRDGIKGSGLQKEVVDYVQKEKLFSPEFLNRFDGVVVYEPLSEDNLIAVAKLMLIKLEQKLKNKNINLEYTPETIKKLAEDGYDPAFGARPMRRIVDLIVGDVIGSGILNGQIQDGDTITLLPGQNKEEYLWQKKTASETPGLTSST